MSKWTAENIPDLTGKLALVTGANSGLGLQTSLQLARHGAAVIMACRDLKRGEVALKQLLEQVPEAQLELVPLDLADLASIRSLAQLLITRGTSLDLLLNNAGVMAIPQRKTADGFEMQFGTNHLGHFALTGLLLPLLEKQPGARIVTVSSVMHRIGKIDFSDLQHERRYQTWSVYGQAKLANLLFAFELQRLLTKNGLDLLSLAAHPGYASTNLQTTGPLMSGSNMGVRMNELGNRIFAQPAAQGALPSLYAATAPDVVGGAFYGPDGLFGMRGYPHRAQATSPAYDEQVARRLWTVSSELTQVQYPL